MIDLDHLLQGGLLGAKAVLLIFVLVLPTYTFTDLK